MTPILFVLWSCAAVTHVCKPVEVYPTDQACHADVDALRDQYAVQLVWYDLACKPRFRT